MNMTLLGLVSYTCVLIYLYSGWMIVRLNTKSLLNWLFGLICLSLSFYAFCGIFLFSVSDAAQYQFWVRLSSVSWTTLPALSFHTYLVLTYPRTIKNPAALVMNYLPAAVLMAVALGFYPFSSGIEMHGGYAYPVMNTDNPWFLILWGVLGAYQAAAVLVLVNWGRSTASKRDRSLAVLMLVTLAVNSLLLMATNFVLPVLRLNVLPAVGPLISVIYIAGIWYAIRKYQFLKYRTQEISHFIIRSHNDPVVMLGASQTVISVSPGFAEISGSDNAALSGKGLDSLIVEWQAVSQEMVDNQGVMMGPFEIHLLGTRNTRMRMELIIKQMNDQNGELLGYVMLFCPLETSVERECLSLRDYDLTPREQEIVVLLTQGLSNREIGERLFISEATVKVNLYRIYQKTDVKNRVGLAGLLKSGQLNLE